MSSIRYYLPEVISDNIMYYLGRLRYVIQSYYNTNFTADYITNNILVGDLASSLNKNAMKENDITHIVSVINGSSEMFPDDFKYHIIHINDDTWVDIKKHFSETNEFIEKALKNPKNKVMVHCHKGVSRSVTMVCAYLLWTMNKVCKIPEDKIDDVVDNIISDVKNHRSIACPNEGFINDLKDYVREINNYKLN